MSLQLPNRLTTAQINALVNPAMGTFLYNTTTNMVNYFNGTTWLALDTEATTGSGHILFSTSTGLTATGTNQATAFAITSDVNNFTTVASGTGCVLPAAVVGMSITIMNDGANTLAVYGNGSDTVDTHAGPTGTTLSVAHRAAEFICLTAGAWTSTLLGAVAS